MGFFFFLKKLTHLFLAVLGLCCCVWGSSGCGKQGVLPLCAWLIVVASLVAEHRLWGVQAAVVAARGLECTLGRCAVWA